jgi:hypothetical protein
MAHRIPDGLLSLDDLASLSTECRREQADEAAKQMITQIVRYALAHVLALAAFVVFVPFEGRQAF